MAPRDCEQEMQVLEEEEEEGQHKAEKTFLDHDLNIEHHHEGLSCRL